MTVTVMQGIERSATTYSYLLNFEHSGGAHVTRLEGDLLHLECGRRDAVARAIRDAVIDDLHSIAQRLHTSGFRERLKGSREILRKVQRKRAEAELSPLSNENQSYDPIDVEDSWACRFVVLLQPEIVEVLEELLDYVTGAKGREAKLSMQKIIVYSNRPENDPLALHNMIRRAIADFAEAYPGLPQPMPPLNPESGYSSVHIILHAPVNVDLGTGHQQEVASFEVQIRDVFEDGWGEISHRLAYKRQSMDTKSLSQQIDRQLRNARSRELNALKASADACSQHATLIDRSLTYFLDTAGLNGTELSVSRIEDDVAAILGKIPSNMSTPRRLIADAYRMMQAAHESAVREIDNRVTCNFYNTAAATFEKAINSLPDDVHASRIAEANGMPIRYYLTLEFANATVKSIPAFENVKNSRSARNALEVAIAAYRSLLSSQSSSDEYQRDATIYLRLGQALVRNATTIEALDLAIETLHSAKTLADSDPKIKSLGPNHWLPLEVMHQIAFSQFRRAVLLKKTPGYQEALHVAANEGELVAGEATAYARGNSGNVNLAHKCINNALYFLETYCRHRRRSGLAVDDSDMVRIRNFISVLRRRPYRRFVETHTETIDTLMRAAEFVSDTIVAVDMANKNVAKLRQIARARGSLDDLTRINEVLDIDQRKMYREAMKISRPLDLEDESDEA